ncbi:MAG: RnfABCDGE type electron transport complex subunit B [Clostridia bacterium]|nr:RnfABCDGE type electron transport complex subunit B [Clostridia bacterium]
MNGILIAVALVAGIGLIAAIGLVLAARFMKVPVDEKAAAIEKMLPGANCGGCGFSGCAGYASAISKDGAPANLCSVGGAEVTKEISAFLGIEAEITEKKTAVVLCNGRIGNAERSNDYIGITSCKSVSALFGGTGDCKFGCTGLGDCVKVCENDAIHVVDGVAVVDPKNCIACGKCVSVCPKHIIAIVPDSEKSLVLCSNPEPGANVRKVCKVGCIGCKMCEKACESEAIKVIDGRAQVDRSKCVACGKCLEACKIGCIYDFRK